MSLHHLVWKKKLQIVSKYVRSIVSTRGRTKYYIDPDVCIECGACETACPVSAIYHESEVPEDEIEFIEKNRKFFQS